MTYPFQLLPQRHSHGYIFMTLQVSSHFPVFACLVPCLSARSFRCFFFFFSMWVSCKASLWERLDWLLQKVKQLVFCQHQFPVSIKIINDKQVLFG